MNQIEIWNGILGRKVIRCGTFSSVKALNKSIESFIEHWNSNCAPIAWTASAGLLARSCGFDRRGGLTGGVAVSLPV
jgi:hypothetical protein